MRVIPIAFSLFIGGAGCHSIQPCKEGHEPARCAEACPATTTSLPPQKIEVQTPETIVVKAPAPKVVVEQQAPPPTNFGAAPSMPMAYAPVAGMAPMQTYGNTEVREKNSVGLMFTSISIPIPWLRLKVIPEGTEVTTRNQLPPTPAQFGAVSMQPMAPAMMPVQQYGATTGGQIVYTGTQVVPVQGVQAVQVPVASVPVSGVGPSPRFGGTPGSENPADTVEKLRARLKECEELQSKLKSLQAKD